MPDTFKRIVLASRPEKAVTPDNFRIEEVAVPELKDGEVMVRNHFLSLDPYMRGRMNDAKSYAAPQPLDEVMIGGTVGEVVASKNPRYIVGDKVLAMFGWQEIGISDGSDLQKVDTTLIPLSAYLGVTGMPGITAWVGLNRICRAKPGETVAVSAASGAVGSVVGQLAKLNGCRVIGFAGGKEKCNYVTGELGFDACIDYKSAADSKALAAMLEKAAPDGVDCYFDNVGGVILNTVMAQMNAFGRIAICGAISGYESGPQPIDNPMLILRSRLKLEGFIVFEHADARPDAIKEISTYVAQGRLKFRESVAQGLEHAPEAFIGLLKGKNFGKQLVKLV